MGNPPKSIKYLSSPCTIESARELAKSLRARGYTDVRVRAVPPELGDPPGQRYALVYIGIENLRREDL